jgi:hypothetical protein
MAFPPPVVLFNEETHRLIPSIYSAPPGTVLADVAEDAEDLANLVLLDGASNDRIQAELYGMPGISTFELVYGISNAHIINAAFTHPSPDGARFNDHTRGAWYAAPLISTALSEVTYHKQKHLFDIVVPELPYHRPDHELFSYDDWGADFHASFHRIERNDENSKYLEGAPVPRCYFESQQLARQLLEMRSNGIVYDSVRAEPPAICIVCFRPALVYNVHRLYRYDIELTANPTGYDSTVQEYQP